MIACGNKNLITGDFIAAVALWLSFGTKQAQICSCVRFGQVHGTCPLTAD
ncbi:hypothetical protein MGSAQ_001676 [marine sediment metagenome]|uniref:Uncharacterized protein n=1 Tax=marine sediment metagenome TaxID=412755 RepID=A0A1B6NU13_9ZZZZ